MQGGNSNSNNNNLTMMNIPKVPKSTAPTSPTSGTNVFPSYTNQQAGNNACALASASAGRPPRPPSSPRIEYREQDRYVPIANVIRVMRRMLPSHAKIADEAKETVQECVSEFISFVTEEANERCHTEQRKTITADDLIWAMSRLGFDNYVSPLSRYLHRYRELEGGDHHRAPRTLFPRHSLVSPTMMVRPTMAGPNPSPVGVGFGINHGSANTTTITTATATTSTSEKDIGVGGSGAHGFRPTNSISFDVGSCSNDDILEFDDPTFDLPLVASSSTAGASTSSNTFEGGAQEVDFFDPFAQFK